MASIIRFKRNQVEDAFTDLGGGYSDKHTLSRIRRMLDADRILERKRSGAGTEPFAFFDDLPEGSGNEVLYTAFDAFALWLGLTLLYHGWPQSKVVRLLRDLKAPLRNHYKRIMKRNTAEVLEQFALAKDTPDQLLPDPTFLVYSISIYAPLSEVETHSAYITNNEDQYNDDAKNGRLTGQVVTFFELTVLAHRVAAALAKTKPTRRGPKPK